MFVLQASPAYWAPVVFSGLNAAGQLVEYKFDAEFKRLTRDQHRALDERATAEKWTTSRLLEEIMTNWRAVQDADGRDIPWSLPAVDVADNQFPGLISAVVRAFYESVAPKASAFLAAEKN